MFNPSQELYIWGPIDGRPIYIEPFAECFEIYPKKWKKSWSHCMGYFKNDKITYICDFKGLKSLGLYLYNNYVVDKNKFRKAYIDFEKVLVEIRHFEEIINSGLSNYSKIELIKLYQDWKNINVNFWLHGFLPELVNWGGEDLIKKLILKQHKENFSEIFEALLAPTKLSFFQTEELELFKLKINNGEISEHQKKYYWLRNSYCFTQVLDNSYFKNEIKNISTKEAKERILEINSYTRKIEEKKKYTIKKFNVGSDIESLGEHLSFCIWWQDYRKMFIFIANHIITNFIEEISKRLKIQFKELCYYRNDEIVNLLKNNKKINAKSRYSGYLMHYIPNEKHNYYEGKIANDLAAPFIKKKTKSNKLNGIVVSIGNTVEGKVRLLRSPKESHKMQKGEVLVAPMTSPDFILAMRKASAIITDEGGMTSHAAIVSRELGVPCIVGTKIATQILKDGDLVEINTKKGIIKKLK